MKELTTEQKAKAYDEALKRARQFSEHPLQEDSSNIVEYIFPELKESEDERIRKEIIETFKILGDGKIPVDINYADIFTWLEKQGKNKGNNKLIWKHWSTGIAGNGDGEPIYLIKIGNTYSLSSCLGFECDYIELSELDNLMLEKQGEQESLCDKCRTSHSCQDITALGRCAVEHEQKPADKVEPKFKVGDWVIDKQGIVHQIANVIENVTNCTYGYDIVGGGYFNDNIEGVRLWTIQDAKDGDVLASELCDSIILFKGIKDDIIDFYCDYDFSKIDIPGDRFAVNNGQHYGNVEDSKDFHPATKEQCDTLFAKMKEAGYEWDAEKKELKKIIWIYIS